MWRIPEHYVLVAAADHCLRAAYAGECPGVDPDKVLADIEAPGKYAVRFAVRGY